MAKFIFSTVLILSLLLLGSMIREKKTPLLWSIFASSCMVSLWLICDTVPYYYTDPQILLFFFRFKFLVTILLILSVYMFTLQYTGFFKKIAHPRYFGVIIVLTLVVSFFTNSFPFAFISDLSVDFRHEFAVYKYHPEIGFMLYVTYGVLTAVFCIGLFSLKALLSPKHFRTEMTQIIVSLLICLGATGLSIWLMMSSDYWRDDMNDVSSIFLMSFIFVIYVVTHKSTIRYEDRVMQLQMSEALREREFRLVLQPQYSWDGSGYRITGAEALIRWNRDGEVFSTPDMFIPSAERNGMILPIGNWVVDEIFLINKSLREENICIKLSINVSSSQLESGVFIKHLEKVWQENQRSGVPIDLVIEITESFIIKETEMVCEALKKLRAMGIEIALDDFGTGYSSLSYLQKLPIDYLKVDKSFIDDIHTNELNLTSHILEIARTLNLKTVVEGTETEDQVSVLEGQCDYFQGYYFCKPVPMHDLIHTIKYA